MTRVRDLPVGWKPRRAGLLRIFWGWFLVQIGRQDLFHGCPVDFVCREHRGSPDSFSFTFFQPVLQLRLNPKQALDLALDLERWARAQLVGTAGAEQGSED